MSYRSIALSTLAAGALLSAPMQMANAADVAPAKPAPGWWDTFSLTTAIDSGLIVNPDNPQNGLNFGSLYTDRSNLIQLNQVLITAQRPIDSTSKDYDFGFKIQGLYGSDGRYTHSLGEGEYWINSRYQLSLIEANAQAHLPWFAGYLSGGIDVKAGQFISIQGAEFIEAGANYFYSHSYIYNFGIAGVLTGASMVAHVIPEIDLYAGFNTGNFTTIGWPGDNNGGVGFEGGIGLNLLGGNLTALLSTNIAPQNPATALGVATCNCAPSSTLRFYNDLVVIWKATDKLTFQGEADWVHDDAVVAGHAGVDGYGVAGYAAYALTDWLKLVGRAEVWRDNNNYFVNALGTDGNFNFANALHGYVNYGANYAFPAASNFPFGFPPPGTFAAGPTTYLELTAGLNITAPPIPNFFNVPTAYWFKSVTLRPEIRYDAALNSGATPFNVQNGVETKSSQLTFGGDIIVKF